jgi:hypothetical protein
VSWPDGWEWIAEVLLALQRLADWLVSLLPQWPPPPGP